MLQKVGKKEIDSRHMEFEKLKEVIVYCYRDGTRFFVLNGGEPMLYPKIKELILFLKTMDIHVNCFTSGYGVSEEIIQLWDFEKHRLCLSLNGPTKEMNSLTRQGFDITIDVMKKLSMLQKNYGINWVARHDNLKGIHDLLALCEKYSVKYLYVTSEKLTGEGKLVSPLTKEDMFLLAKVIREYSGEIYNGINCLYALKYCITDILNGNIEENDLTKHLKKLAEHRQMMIVSMKYLLKKWNDFIHIFLVKESIRVYEYNCSIVQKWLNMALKYELTGNKRLLNVILNEIPTVYKSEYKCLDQLINTSIIWDKFNREVF